MGSDIWTLIPAHNEESKIGKVIKGIRKYCDRIVVVDDGSDDDTGKIAEGLGCITLRHDRNAGKGAALKTGFEWITEKTCGAVITIDADGQHDTEEIPRFLDFFDKKRLDGILIGTRTINRRKMPLYRALPNRIGELFISVAARRHIRDTQSGFRLYSRGVIERVRCRSDGFDFEAEILVRSSRQGFGIYSIPIRTIYQDNYTTHFRPIRDFYKISKVVIRNIL
jgi:glycosyltransferase involved in cell wall biosynthesis